MRRSGLHLVGPLLVIGLVSSASSANAQEAAAARLTLKDAVAQAIARNPTAEVAAVEIRRAETLVTEARSAWLPTLTGNAAYTRLDSDRQLSGRIIAGIDSVSANLTLSVPIVAPKGWVAWNHAKDNVDVTRLGSLDVRRTVAVATARAYLAIIAQRRVLDAATRARDTSRAHFDFAHTRLAGGVGNKLDEVRAEQELKTNEATVVVGTVALGRAREALGVLVGGDAPVDAAEEPGLGAPPSLPNALEESQKLRADVTAGERRVEAADRVVRDTWADYSPTLTAVGQPFYQSPASLIQPLTGWQAQLVSVLPIFDGGLRYGQKHEREALAEEARVALAGTLRQARSEVRTAFDAMVRSDEALAMSRDAARLAAEALALANLAYRAGATTNLEVIDAERRARDADTQAAVAEDTARQARLDLLAAAGRFP